VHNVSIEAVSSQGPAAGGRLQYAVYWCIRALWFGVVPALFAGLAFRYFIPPSNGGAGGVMGEVARLATIAPAPVAVVLFLFFALLLRYWRSYLPGSEAWLVTAREAEPFNLVQAAIWGGALLAAVLGAVVLRSSFYQSYRVLSASMLPTLEPGAHLLTTQFAYGLRPFSSVVATPRRGDVVVFGKDSGPDFPDQLVKRVIGLPGDTITMKGGRPLINGWEVPSCTAGRYVYLSAVGMLDASLTLEFLEDRVYMTAQSVVSKPLAESYTVRPGEVFVLGDNRNNSSDSRVWNGGRGGGLPVTEIRGRVDRLLVGVKRNGEADFSQLMQTLGVNLHLEGIDSAPLQTRIERCLKERPKETFPPKPGTSAPEATP